MKKVFTFVVMAAACLGVQAQTMEFRFKGEPVANEATVTIQAEYDEDFELYECNTNPFTETDRLVLHDINGDIVDGGKAHLEILSNTLGAQNIQWCMGGLCVPIKSTTYDKDFEFLEDDVTVKYDCEVTQYGEMLTKLSATVGEETATIYIKFVNTDPAGISSIAASDVKETARYLLSGQRIAGPQRGLNIVKYSDGRVVKQVVR